MKLVELLETAIKTHDMIVNPSYRLGIVYSSKYQCFLWCWKDGKAIRDIFDRTRYKTVKLSNKLFEDDNWYLDINLMK